MMTKTMKSLLSNIEIDDVLDVIGLERKRGGGILAAVGLVTVGAAIGAGVALLFAPEKGSVTREMISEKLPKVNEVVDKVKTGVQSFARNLQDQASQLTQQGQSNTSSPRNITS